jgi:hypothetical protein
MRGLLEGENQQTFEVCLPLELRQQFNSILFTIAVMVCNYYRFKSNFIVWYHIVYSPRSH